MRSSYAILLVIGKYHSVSCVAVEPFTVYSFLCSVHTALTVFRSLHTLYGAPTCLHGVKKNWKRKSHHSTWHGIEISILLTSRSPTACRADRIRSLVLRVLCVRSLSSSGARPPYGFNDVVNGAQCISCERRTSVRVSFCLCVLRWSLRFRFGYSTLASMMWLNERARDRNTERISSNKYTISCIEIDTTTYNRAHATIQRPHRKETSKHKWKKRVAHKHTNTHGTASASEVEGRTKTHVQKNSSSTTEMLYDTSGFSTFLANS